MKVAVMKALIGMFALLVCTTTASANTFTFFTPSGATTGGGPVDASAVFTTEAGTVIITLQNLLANPTDVAQLLSDLNFTLSNGATTGTLASSSAQQLTVASNGNFTLGSTAATGWGLNNNVSGGLQLDALGFVGPAGLIIGPPGPGNVYSNANASIAGNVPHNPFLNETATFTLDILGVTVDTNITSVVFSFGTTAGIDVPATGTAPVPEPTTMLLLGFGLVGIWGIRKKLKK